MTPKERSIRRRISRRSPAVRSQILMEIIKVMYPEELASGDTTEWEVDTIERVASVLSDYNLLPTNES